MIATAPRRRGGFTLIELIAALSLALIVTAMVIGALYSGAFGSQRVITSADRVGGWLLIAKQRALRSRSPCGVRFLRNNTDPNIMSEAIYIETPTAYVPNPNNDPNGMRIVLLRTIDDGASNPTEINTRLFVYIPTSSATALSEFTTNVQSGDLGSIRLPDGTTLLFRLKGAPKAAPARVGPTPMSSPPSYATADQSAVECSPDPVGTLGYTVYELPIIDTTVETFPNPAQKTLQTVVGAGFTKFTAAGASTNIQPQLAPTFSTTVFSFQPQARPLFGEPILQLPPSAVIDARAATNYSSLNVPGTGDFDVMFGPSGQVINESNGLLAFWIRDPDPEKSTGPNDYANAGEQVLVVVYTRTGAIATQPVVITGTDPYAAAKDGINAGF